jgi:glycosyltransferase involved in cell wall biosynthesis
MNVTRTCPRVVALVPAWNAASFIEGTLAALSAQTYPNFEVLVSVDLSTDTTLDLCRRYARSDARVRVIAQRERQGFVGNTASLLREAAGDYFFWAWHDDILLPDYVSRLVPVMEQSPRVASAFSDVELHRLDGRVETLTYSALDGLTDPVQRAKRVLWIPENWWLPHRGLFRPAHARRIGGFKRHWAGDYKSDWPWAVHMAILGEHVRVPEVLCRKFIKVTSLSASWRRNRRVNLAATLACAREIRRSDLGLREKIRLHMTAASVMKAFVVQRYTARDEFRRVHEYHRAAAAAEARITPGTLR